MMIELLTKRIDSRLDRFLAKGYQGEIDASVAKVKKATM